MANTLDKARELGAAISNSDEYTELKRTEEELHSDSESFSLFSKMNLSKEYREKALKNDKIIKYIEAEDKYNKMMRDINTIISYYTGHVATKGDCSSCSGCGSKKE